MKTLLLMLFFSAPVLAGEVEVTDLNPNSKPDALLRQAVFKKKVEEAIKKVKPGDVEVQIVFRREDDMPHPAQTYKMPSIFSLRPSRAIHVNPSTLGFEDEALEHIAIHEIMHIKFDTMLALTHGEDEAEAERCIEIEVYRLVGKAQYSKYIECQYYRDEKWQSLMALQGFIKQWFMWLGVWEKR